MSYFVRRIMKTITFDNSTVKKSSFTNFRSSGPEVFLGKGVLKICSKFTGDRPCESAISIKLLHIFRTTFLKNTSGWLLLWFPEVKVLWKVCGNCAFLQSKVSKQEIRWNYDNSCCDCSQGLWKDRNKHVYSVKIFVFVTMTFKKFRNINLVLSLLNFSCYTSCYTS